MKASDSTQNCYIYRHPQNLAHTFWDSDLHLYISDKNSVLLHDWICISLFTCLSLGRIINHLLQREDVENKKEMKARLLNSFKNSFCKLDHTKCGLDPFSQYTPTISGIWQEFGNLKCSQPLLSFFKSRWVLLLGFDLQQNIWTLTVVW